MFLTLPNQVGNWDFYWDWYSQNDFFSGKIVLLSGILEQSDHLRFMGSFNALIAETFKGTAVFKINIKTNGNGRFSLTKNGINMSLRHLLKFISLCVNLRTSYFATPFFQYCTQYAVTELFSVKYCIIDLWMVEFHITFIKWWMDAWDSIMFLLQKQARNRHGNQLSKWGEVHLWHRTK